MTERTQNIVIGSFVALFAIYLLVHVIVAVLAGRLG